MENRIGRSELQALGKRLSQRDWSILWFLRQHRFATTSQLRRIFFTGHATQSASTRACIRVLDRLLRQRALTRLERRVGGVRHGSASYIWCLDVAGERLTRKEHSIRRRNYEPSPQFLDHILAVTDVAVQLREAEAAGHFMVQELEVETEAWREFVAPGGVKMILKPDLRIAIDSASFQDYWYIEVDRGTESIPVRLRKSRAYEDYRRTGHAQNEHGVFPRILWVLPDRKRVEQLGAAIEAEHGLPDRMLVTITGDKLIDTLIDPP